MIDTSNLGRLTGRGAVGHDTSGPTTDDSMTRSGERLSVGTEQVETGRVRLRKYVVTENLTRTVPVSREEVRIEREPITEGNRGAALSGPDLSEEEHEVVLRAERPVVEKETVPVERVRLDKETVTEQQQVSEQVSKEQIDMEGDAGRTTDSGADVYPEELTRTTSDVDVDAVGSGQLVGPGLLVVGAGRRRRRVVQRRDRRRALHDGRRRVGLDDRSGRATATRRQGQGADDGDGRQRPRRAARQALQHTGHDLRRALLLLLPGAGRDDGAGEQRVEPLHQRELLLGRRDVGRGGRCGLGRAVHRDGSGGRRPAVEGGAPRRRPDGGGRHGALDHGRSQDALLSPDAGEVGEQQPCRADHVRGHACRADGRPARPAAGRGVGPLAGVVELGGRRVQAGGAHEGAAEPGRGTEVVEQVDHGVGSHGMTFSGRHRRVRCGRHCGCPLADHCNVTRRHTRLPCRCPTGGGRGAERASGRARMQGC